jgi:heme/copper-type cytochrome/quinol oxidase subunit 2
MIRFQLLSLTPFVVVALIVLLVPLPFSTGSTTRQVTVTAEQFAFNPPVLRVNQGDRIRLTLQAADVTHGFYLDGYGLQKRIEPGLSQQVEFVADQAGKFRYRCSVSCGNLHPFMIGELVVSPNWPFTRTLGLTLVVVAATLFYLWSFPLSQVQLS